MYTRAGGAAEDISTVSVDLLCQIVTFLSWQWQLTVAAFLPDSAAQARLVDGRVWCIAKHAYVAAGCARGGNRGCSCICVSVYGDASASGACAHSSLAFFSCVVCNGWGLATGGSRVPLVYIPSVVLHACQAAYISRPLLRSNIDELFVVERRAHGTGVCVVRSFNNRSSGST